MDNDFRPGLRRTKRSEFVECELRTRPQILKELRECRLAGFGGLQRIQPRPGNLTEILQHLADFVQFRDPTVRATSADAVQEPAAPGRQCLHPFVQRYVIIRNKRRKFKVLRPQRLERRLVELLKHALRRVINPATRPGFDQLGDPFGRRIAFARAQRAAQATVRLGRADRGAKAVEDSLHLRICHFAQGKEPLICSRMRRVMRARNPLGPGGFGSLPAAKTARGHAQARVNQRFPVNGTPRRPATPVQAALTRLMTRFHNGRMEDATTKPGLERELKRLERRLDEVVGVVAQLKEENRALRQRQDSLSAERATLMQKNEQVRTRVEAMIGRLKAMESGA